MGAERAAVPGRDVSTSDATSERLAFGVSLLDAVNFSIGRWILMAMTSAISFSIAIVGLVLFYFIFIKIVYLDFISSFHTEDFAQN